MVHLMEYFEEGTDMENFMVHLTENHWDNNIELQWDLKLELLMVK